MNDYHFAGVTSSSLCISSVFVLVVCVRPDDPLKAKLEGVRNGITRAGVELVMGEPYVVTDWLGLEVLTYIGRDGDAEIQILQERRLVVHRRWAEKQRESEWALVWRWFLN